jgi:MAX-like protein X
MSFQQQQPLQQNSAGAIKESYRSNSLPINANIQLPKEMMSGVSCDFAVPKYPNASNTVVSAQPSKSRSSRARSNSINLRHGQLLMTPIQSATSEPTLNVNASSALAQLLTNSSVTSLLGQKAQSVSSSAMSHSTPQQHQQPQRANSFTSSSLVQNSILMAVSSINNPKQSSNQAPSTSSGIYHTPTLSPESAFENSHHEMSSSMSPERCLSLSKYHPRENQRRAGHIHAEQKRRYNIKNGFDMLHQLIPQLQQNPNAKVCLNTFETLKKLKKIYHPNS